MINLKQVFFLLLTITFVNVCVFAQPVHIVNRFKVSGDGSWDYLAVQPDSKRLFISHGTQVNIIDKNTGDSIATINGFNGVHGFAFVPALYKAYITSGRSNEVIVIDLATLSVIKRIKGGENPDAVFYEPLIKKIIVCNGKTKNLSIIDPATDIVIKTIQVTGRPEVAVSDGQNYLYVNLEDKNEIVQIDLTTCEVKAHWSLAPDEAPTGMAIDKKNHLLFSACSETNHLIILDAASGKIIKRIKIGEDCDGVAFDESLPAVYTSNAGGTITVIRQVSKTVYSAPVEIPTMKGAKTLAVDSTTHKIYLPAADTKKEAAGKTEITPDTFTVMVMDK